MTDIRTSGLGGIPKGNTSNRSIVFPSPQIGDVYYNGELEILEIYNGATWVAVSAPPSTPQIISVTDASSGDAYSPTGGKLAVVFQAGSGGGTPSQYNVFTVAGGHSASTLSTTVTLTGLTPGTSYEVYGNGQNNFGTTVNSPNQAAVTPTTRPQAPTIGTATTASQGSDVTVTWTLGATGGKNISAITITPYLNGTTAQAAQTAATTSSTSHAFTGLTVGSSYTFKVKVTNANGDSPESFATNSITVTNLLELTYVLVGGGGGGGGGEGNPAGDGAGGGGAGGYKTGTLGINAGTYSIEVGAGGAGDTTRAAFGGGSNGNLTRIHQNGNTVYSLTVDGGGGGGGNDGFGQNGGCGGGNSGDAGASAGIGNAGGNGGGSGGARSGGGGGGIAPANGGSQTNGGNGGAGRVEPIKSIALGGGGAGGGGSNSNANGSATDGGGANSTGTGGKGGGGGGARSGPNNGYSGGSGVVILKSTTQASATTGSPIATTSGSFYIYEFQSSGSITY